MRWDHSPGALYEKLHQERANCQGGGLLREGPQRDSQDGKKSRNHNGLSAADLLGKCAERHAARNRTNKCDGSDCSHGLGAELVLHFQKIQIDALASITSNT